MKKFYCIVSIWLITLLSWPFVSYSQITTTIVSGVIIDSQTKQTIPAATVIFPGTTISSSADNDGKFTLQGQGEHRQVRVSFIGYKTVSKTIEPGRPQTINIALVPDNQLLAGVVIKSGKKTRYRNKDNPAVELIRKVIAHKRFNKLENYDFAEYQQYEKMMFALSDLSEHFKNKRIFKNYQFLFRKQDSSEIGGKNLLPLYMEEKISNNYFRKSPYRKKQVITATKQVKYDASFVDNQGLTMYFNSMYQDINIYDNNIAMLGNQLLSPIADEAPSF